MPGPALVPVLGDQLSHDLASLRGADKARTVVLMVEVREEATYVRHHQAKIAMFFSAMRHFAAELRTAGWRVDYTELDDPANAGSFTGEVLRAVERHDASAVCVVEPGEYAHHIQRLMVLGNFALLAGILPQDVEDWFLVVYADAYEWVELPNVAGMALFADGGRLASKPYAASGAYIDRMSNYCGQCRYDVKAKTGPDACPFNALYWHFLARNEDKLAPNPRLRNPYATWRRMSEAKQREYIDSAEAFLAMLEPAGDYWARDKT